MKKVLIVIVLFFGFVMLCLLLAGQLGLLRGKRPVDIGAPGHLLKAPGINTLNVVSSQAVRHPHTDLQLIAPLQFEGNAGIAWERLKNVVRGMQGATLVVVQPDYMHVEFETKVLKFVDDVEFVLDAERHTIDMRSASRVGSKDFGVNRARLESIRASFDMKPVAGK